MPKRSFWLSFGLNIAHFLFLQYFTKNFVLKLLFAEKGVLLYA
jgi:hypothetical protein